MPQSPGSGNDPANDFSGPRERSQVILTESLLWRRSTANAKGTWEGIIADLNLALARDHNCKGGRSLWSFCEFGELPADATGE
jgi:hypothetical protein